MVNLLKAKRLFDDTEVMETYLIPQGEAVPAPDPIRNNPEIETKFKESAEVGAQKLNQVQTEEVAQTLLLQKFLISFYCPSGF